MALFKRVALLTVWLAACSPPESTLTLDRRLHSDQPYGVPARANDTRTTFNAKGFNAFIINAAAGFGPADYLWDGDGVTRDIYYQGVLIAKPHAPGKCHCVGATFQVYMTAFEAWDKQYGGSSGDLRGLDAAQVKQLKQIWYVATPDEAGSQAALANFSLGAAVSDPAQAQQGDLVQIWRNNDSGHSVIFDSWVEQGGTITGITYFSCQSSGPGFVTETIGTGPKQVIADRIYIGHPVPPVDPPPDIGTPDLPPADHGPSMMDGTQGGDLPPVQSDSVDPRRPVDSGCSCELSRSSHPSTPVLLALLLCLIWIRRR